MRVGRSWEDFGLFLMADKRMVPAVDGHLMDPDASNTSPEQTISDDVDADILLDQPSVDPQLAADWSESSNEGEFNMHTHDNQTFPQSCQSSSSYTVTCTVTIALAIPKEDPVKPAGRKRKQGSRHDRRGPKRKVYHIEYNLLPDLHEPTKVNVVMYGLSAEALMEHESKSLPPWQEEDFVWLAWSHSVDLNVTKELLFKLRSHKVTFRVWDSLDKVPLEARFCRPRAFSASQGKNLEDEDEAGGTRSTVDKLRSLYEKENPRRRTFQRENTSVDNLKPSNKACTNGPAVSDMRMTHESTADTELTGDTGIAWVELSAVHLLAGSMSVTGRFLSPFGRLSDGLCSITVDQPLISEELKSELKPLVITIHSASFLPCSPVPFDVLQQQCLPVYCQYKFLAAPTHRTSGHPHGSTIYFRDVNVIFTGLLGTGELLEYLRGPPLQIEVHDRDKKHIPKSSAIVSTRLGAAKRVTQSRVEIVELPHPYGVAELDLSDLVRGRRCLNYCLPIKCCHRGRWKDAAGTLDEGWDTSIPVGHYFEANSMLNIRVEMICPLDPDRYKNEALCPFGRIIYIFNCSNKAVLSKLKSEILRINMAAFQLECKAEETAQVALCAYKMNEDERASTNLDYITGFHILDNTLHFFVLEGLKDQAIKKLWETVPMKLGGDVENQVTVLYNSSLSFSKRIYKSLDLGLTSIHLHKPLEDILKHSHVYIRDMVPYTCLQAMLRLNLIFQVKKLGKVVHCNLFPSAEMVLSLSREFGVIPKREEKRPSETTEETQEDTHRPATPRKTHLNTINTSYIAWKQQQKVATKNFVQVNIEKVHKTSSLLQKPKPKVFLAKVEDGQIAHNYSIQTMNCTNLAKELLRKEMEKTPTRRFTYSQHYHSLMVEPVDVEAEKKASELRSRDCWRTKEGFICHGFTSSIEANRHPKQTDEARVEELKKPWRENILHANTLCPTLNRTRWAWNRRHEDFELYKHPPAFFDPSTPITIHLAGEAVRQFQQMDRQAPNSKAVRKPDKNMEGSSKVQEKKQDVIKDNPVKLSGKKPLKHADIPITERAKHSVPSCNQKSRTDARAPPRNDAQYGKLCVGHNKKPHSLLPLSQSEGISRVSQKPPNVCAMCCRKLTNGHLQNSQWTRPRR